MNKIVKLFLIIIVLAVLIPSTLAILDVGTVGNENMETSERFMCGFINKTNLDDILPFPFEKY